MAFIPNQGTGSELLDLSPEFCTFEEHDGGLAELRLVTRYLVDIRVILKHPSPWQRERFESYGSLLLGVSGGSIGSSTFRDSFLFSLNASHAIS